MSFHDAMIDAMKTLASAAGVSVTFHRGDDWIKLQAVPGQTRFDLTDEYGTIVESRSRDFIVSASDLKLNGTAVTPLRGDLVKESAGREGTHVYIVSRPDTGEQVWRYSDTDRTRIRIHTVLKEVA